MPYSINLSQIGGNKADLDKAIENHIAALHSFSREVGKPRPVAHPFVEACIKRIQHEGKADEYVSDYTCIDDTPPPPTLEQKKQALHLKLVEAENAAKYKILPQRKMRLANTKMQIASAKPEDERTAEEREDVASYLLVQQAWQKLELVGAQGESDIDDLTEADIDNWKLPDFG